MGAIPRFLALFTVAAAVAAAPVATAQQAPTRLDIWDLDIGMHVADIPDAFVEYACGTNGGPPSLRLESFADFTRCKPDEHGLHEVYFEYDDELEYWARSLSREIEVRMFRGTQVFDYPAVMTLLIDDAGIVRGWRAVTDPRQTFRERNELWTLAGFMKQRFGANDWHCRDLPRGEGESPAGSFFVKDVCTKATDDRRMLVERHYYQKKGQAFVNPHTKELQTDDFESSSRFEIFDRTVE